ncbi:MAG: DEAD/DEAH box helicase family protein [Oscillospiraceae bacterium]|nr:DEAD/DEAH box helicase family protein [Oscillospiraceae bacterium]
MPTKAQMYAQMADKMAVQLTGSWMEWTAFLTTASRLYKYPFHEQLMIYAQRPDATACADYELWNKRMGRYVRRGSTGIALLDDSGDRVRLRYVFDISDTGEREHSQRPFLWKMEADHIEPVQTMLENKFGVTGKEGLAQQLADVAAMLADEYWQDNQHDVRRIVDGSLLEEYDDLNLMLQFKSAATVSITYSLMSRCGLEPEQYFDHEDFMAIFDFNTPQAISSLGTAVSQINQQILRQIGIVIQNTEREKLQNKNHEHTDERSASHEKQPELSPDRGLSDPEPDPDQSSHEAPGQVRQDEKDLPEGASSDPVQPAAPVGEAVPAPVGDRGRSEQQIGTADAPADAGRRRNGRTEGQRSHEVGGTGEQLQGPGRGADSGGAYQQLSFELFLSEAEQISQIDQAESVSVTPSALTFPQEYIDHFLRLGSNTDDHRTVLVNELSKPKSQEHMVDFVQKIYHGANGLKIDGSNISVWFSEDGMRIARGDSARYARTAQTVPWDAVTARIGELIEQGQFATNVELTEAPSYERKRIAEQIWYVARNISEEYRDAHLTSVRGLRGGFPDETEVIASRLMEPESLETIIREFQELVTARQQGEAVLRFRHPRPEPVLDSLVGLTLPRKTFPSELTEIPQAAGFITEDEINEALSGGSNYQGSKGRIYDFYQTNPTPKDQIAFLKKEYGTGGGNNALSRCFRSDEWYDGKGIRYTKPNCAEVTLTWTKVAKRMSELMRTGRFYTPEQLAQKQALDAEKAAAKVAAEAEKATEESQPKMEPVTEEPVTETIWGYNSIKEAHPNDIVLYQIGDFFEMYGEDAAIAAEKLDLYLATRPIPTGGRVDMCGIPKHRLEQYVEQLRQAHNVTIAAVDEATGQHKPYSLEKLQPAVEAEPAQPTIREQYEKYKPVVIAAITEDTAYRNACGHSDRENAVIEGNAAVRRAILSSGDLELIQLYSDVPEFRNRLHQEVIEETQPKLHELLRPLHQDDIDDALRRWNGNMDSKRAVVRYMEQHGREKATAEWLAREYGGESNQPFVVRDGSPERTELPWPKVQRRIAQLIRTEKFYTQDEYDRLEDIDPVAIRERLDAHKDSDSPFVQQVMRDVEAIARQEQPIPETEVDESRFADEQFARENLIPGETTFEIDGRTFMVDRVNLDAGSVNFQDITFSNATGFPIFRTEPISFVRRHMEEMEEAQTPEEPSKFITDTVAVYPGEKHNMPYDIVVQTIRTEEPEPPQPVPEAENFRITDKDLGVGGAKAKFHANINAIKLLKHLEEEGRQATPEQQEVLSRYVGWGGLADAFDSSKAGWSEEYKQLKELLTPAEYDAARASTLNAHYTSPTVIQAIYEAVGRMGFTTGNILEPACGVGNFFGMLPQEMSGSRLYGVELDSISGRIAQQLYPKADITVAGFETTDRRDFYDLAIGNVPFGQYKVNDRAYNKLGFNIHNYFFAKALDQVRPGGVVAFVTSRYTMDSKNPEVRKYLTQRADLLGAIRLPNNAFKANAGTEVVSDIIFLQKRDHPTVEEPDWVHTGRNEQGYVVNNYFLSHPEMVLGNSTEESTAHGMDYTVEPIEALELSDQLHDAVKYIRGTYQEAELPDLGDGEAIDTSIPADPNVKNYSYTIVDGDVYYRENSRMVKPDLNTTAMERVKGMVELRDGVHHLIDLQMWESDPLEIRQEQQRLNDLYDAFSAKFGLINDRTNRLAFSDDSSYYLLCSLEVLDEDGKLKRKADMFTKRTIKQHQAVSTVDTASEALAVSIAEKACVDMEYMSRLTGKNTEEIAAELKGVIFKDPSFGNDPLSGWQTADEYLSGNVRQKLRAAQRAADRDPSFAGNVEALKAAQPKDLDASEIEVRLGATWIHPDYIRQFMYETFDTPRYLRGAIDVKYSAFTAEWQITGKTKIGYNNIAAYTTYGTDRANAYRILEDSLNLRDVRIYDTVEDADGKERRVLNAKETTLAAQKQQAIRDAFKDWIWRDPERRQALVRQYNEEMNSTRPREYDGSHIVFSGMNPEITLREHQKNAIAHVLYGGNTLLAHEVGAGKTFEMVAAAMESKRLGLCSKSIFVVPNHLTEQWASEFLRLYPSANILVTTKKDFETHNRKKFCARIATGDYDAVIIGHSQFERIPISKERQERLLQEQIWEITEGISEVEASGGERFTVKQLERTKRSLEARLEKLRADHRKDDVITFEQLGVDRMFVDEAHNYKNMFLYTKMRNVAGLSTTDAQKSSDMFAKCRYLDEVTGSRGIVFATGTPVSNSMTELYTMQRYLQYDRLQQMGMTHFDCWASRFGETVTALELAPEGTGYRARTRFSKFFNLPELMNLFKEVADIKTADQLNLPTPEVEYHTVVAKPTEHQQDMVAALSERAAEVHAGNVDPSVDNMLKITSDGRKLGLDQRIINPLLPDQEGTKVNQCVSNIMQIWRDGEAEKLTQLVFCDISTPKAAPSRKVAKGVSGNLDNPELHAIETMVPLPDPEPAFTVYDDIRSKLIAQGVPPEQIAFIHEANTEVRKKELFAKVRTGQVRVLLGSTSKMGAGTNVQDRLVAIHDLDCPWRPGDLQQRKGRIERQGNQNELVHVYRYVTEGTFDAYLWQTVENKQKFISQIMTSKSPVRSCDDVDETALSFAEIKALCAGDPRIKERMDLDVEVARLKLMKADHQSKQFRLEDNLLTYFPEQIEKNKGFIRGLEADMRTLAAHPHPEEGFAGMEVRGDRLTDKENAGAALLDACKEVRGKEPVQIGSYRGFDMYVSFDAFHQEYELSLRGEMTHKATLGADPRGNLIRIDNALGQMQARLDGVHAQLDNLHQQQMAAKVEVGKPFPFEEELRTKTARLVQLDMELNMDGRKRKPAQREIAKSARPSVLESLRKPVPQRTTEKKQKNHEEVL